MEVRAESYPICLLRIWFPSPRHNLDTCIDRTANNILQSEILFFCGGRLFCTSLEAAAADDVDAADAMLVRRLSKRWCMDVMSTCNFCRWSSARGGCSDYKYCIGAPVLRQMSHEITATLPAAKSPSSSLTLIGFRNLKRSDISSVQYQVCCLQCTLQFYFGWTPFHCEQVSLYIFVIIESIQHLCCCWLPQFSRWINSQVRAFLDIIFCKYKAENHWIFEW